MDSENNFGNKIKKIYNELRKSEKKVADYILANRYEIEEMGLEEIAKNSNVSTPTVVRFTKAMGFEGFKEFKTELLKSGRDNTAELENINLLLDLHVNANDKLEDIPLKIIGLTIKALEETFKFINYETYAKAVKMITDPI